MSTEPPSGLEIGVGGQTARFPAGAPVIIGRNPECDLVITDPCVSSRHLVVEPTPSGWTVRDLGTTNGTFVDGQPFRQGAVTSDWRRLELGGNGDGTPVQIRAGAAHVVSPVPASSVTPVAPVGPAEIPRHPTAIHGIVGLETSATGTRAWSSRRQMRDSPPVTRVLIGRHPHCAIVIDDLLVSREHAALETLADGTTRIVDLGSANGTFVDQRRAEPAIELADGSIVSIGNAEFVFTSGQLRQNLAVTAGAAFAVLGLTVPGRLDNVTFALAPKSFLGILGTSGAGKSTLLKAITGIEPAKAGTVRFDGRDLYANFRALRHRIGYVPQDDILHDQLTVDQSLAFGAELRFPDATPAERRARINEVLNDLGLLAHRGKLVRQLSGGQRKRVSVGLELLHRPSLLILDEPTSGLDPGNERRLMSQLAGLAKSGSGRTVLVVTHSTESLQLCDQVLFLARGGVTIFLGPASRAAASLGANDLPDAFAMAEEHPAPAELRRQFMASSLAAPVRALFHSPPALTRPAGQRTPTVHRSTFVRDLGIFVRRYVRLIVADRRGLVTIALQAPIIALMILAVAPSGTLDRFAGEPGAGNVLMAMVLGIIYAGASNAAREVVKERPILRREQNFGISLLAYLMSKVIVLAVIVVLQAVVFVVLGTARQGTMQPGALLGNARIELFVIVAMSGLSAVAVGLLVSCMVGSADKASTVLPMVLLSQFVLAGLSFAVDRPVVNQVSWLMSARWGFAGTASTVDFEALGGCRPEATPGIGPVCLASWHHSSGVWLGSAVALAVLSAAFLTIAWYLLTRSDPANSLQRGRARVHRAPQRRPARPTA